MTIVARQLRITSIFHAEDGILTGVLGADDDRPTVFLSELFCFGRETTI
jgi:hypothetical protein